MSLFDENAIISCCISDKEIIPKISEEIKPNMFNDADCRDTYSSILSLWDKGIDVNVPELITDIQNESRNEAEATEFITELVMRTKDILPYQYKGYMHKVKADYLTRETKQIFATTLLPNNIDSTIAATIEKLEKLLETKKSTTKSMKTIDEESGLNYFTECKEKKILMGMQRLDNCIGGLQGGEVLVFGARPGVGKSALLLQILTDIAQKGYKVGYFNLEMSEEQVYERMIARTSEIELSRIKNATHFLGDEKERFNEARSKVAMDNFLITSGATTVSEIKSRCKLQNFDVVGIDYLQLIRSEKNYGNRASEVGDISKSIKAMAMELKIPIIVLSQMNRENDENKEPNITDLRESGDIEQDASVIGLMWNITEDRKNKGFKIAKNRQGELNTFIYEFVGSKMSFKELSIDEQKYFKVKPNTIEENEKPWG